MRCVWLASHELHDGVAHAGGAYGSGRQRGLLGFGRGVGAPPADDIFAAQRQVLILLFPRGIRLIFDVVEARDKREIDIDGSP